MNENTPDPHDSRSLPNAQHSVLKQRDPKPFALMTLVNRKPPENGHGNRIGHIASDASRYLAKSQRTGSKRMVSKNGSIGLSNHVGARRTMGLIGSRPTLQPIIQTGNT